MSPYATRTTKSAGRVIATALLAALVVLSTAAALSAAGVIKDTPGTGPGGEGSSRAGKLFGISGNVSAPVTIGGNGQSIALSLRNPNPQTLIVTSMTAEVTQTDKAGCAASNFRVAQTTSTITVPPGSQVTLSEGDRPRVIWVNTAARQNDCLGARLSFSYTGKGTLR